MRTAKDMTAADILDEVNKAISKKETPEPGYRHWTEWAKEWNMGESATNHRLRHCGMFDRRLYMVGPGQRAAYYKYIGKKK